MTFSIVVLWSALYEDDPLVSTSLDMWQDQIYNIQTNNIMLILISKQIETF